MGYGAFATQEREKAPNVRRAALFRKPPVTARENLTNRELKGASMQSIVRFGKVSAHGGNGYISEDKRFEIRYSSNNRLYGFPYIIYDNNACDKEGCRRFARDLRDAVGICALIASGDIKLDERPDINSDLLRFFETGELTTRGYNILTKAGVERLKDIESLSARELIEKRGCGIGTFKSIKKCLDKYGIKLRPDVDKGENSKRTSIRAKATRRLIFQPSVEAMEKLEKLAAQTPGLPFTQLMNMIIEGIPDSATISFGLSYDGTAKEA